MLQTLRNALKIEEIKKQLIFTFFMLIVIRFGSQLPIPGVNSNYLASWIAANGLGDAFNFFNAMTGGSFAQMSVFALNVSPYITSSIIMQLLTIAIPALEEMQKDGEEGRKKIQNYTRYVTIGLALLESTAMAIGFGGQGLLLDYKWHSVLLCAITMTAGSAVVMWIGERITEKGVGNGVSIILLVNILSSMPDDFSNIFGEYRYNQSRTMLAVILIFIAIFAIVLAMVVFVVILQDAERRIPVQYSKKMQGRKQVGGQSSNIPLKVNTAGVIPVIFASSIMQMPIVISQFVRVEKSSVGGRILDMLNSVNWCRIDRPLDSIGLLIYLALIVAFAYFYTSITFNPLEIANNMKVQGGFIPGIRPGKPTSEYLIKILNHIIIVGAIGLIIVSVIPIMFSGLFGVPRLSFAGTSLIIITGVVIETLKKMESQMLVRNYKGFLN
jgi:preprotein translocase, SecY subunit